MNLLVSAMTAASLLCAAGSDIQASENTIQYEVRVKGLSGRAPEQALSPFFERTLRSFRLQEQGAPSLALLRRRAESDLSAIDKILRAEGFFESTASLTVEAAADRGSALVTFAIEPGRPYVLASHRFLFNATALGSPSQRAPAPAGDGFDPTTLGSAIGERARAAPILAAESAAIAKLKRAGRPFAALRERRVEADEKKAVLRVTSTIDPGPFAVFGPLSVRGGAEVDPTFIASYQTWVEGQAFDETALADFERALAETGLFDVAAATRPRPDDLDRRGVVPVALAVRSAAPRTFSIGGRYSTDGGPEGRISFEHRNLAGAGERLSAQLEGGAEDQNALIELRKPQYLRPRQDLIGAISLRREQSDAFDEAATDLALGVERRFDLPSGAAAQAGLGALFEASAIEDASEADGGEADGTAFLLGVPATLRIDARDDALSPTRGYRIAATTTPFFGTTGEEATSFLSTDLQGSIYAPLDGASRFILASRGRVGVILSEDLADVPAPRRLYSGGGGSVRGYAQRFAGPLDASGDPIGGRLAIELGGELRWRVSESFGAVTFVEAAAVSTELSVDEETRVGVGPGLRYFSPIGPVGVDIGFPIDPRPQDESYQLYFFVGQAF